MSFAVAQYRTATVQTASPARIVAELCAGALRFLQEGADALDAGDHARKARALGRAHAIITELQITLNPAAAPEITSQLYALYDFALHQITQATVQNDVEPLRSAIRVFKPLQEAWSQLAMQGR